MSLVGAAEGGAERSVGAALGDELGTGADRLGGVADRVASVGGLEHDGVTRLLERLADQPVHAGEAELHDQGAVLQLGDDVTLLPGPAGALGGDPHARAAGG